jgi:phosphoadenosine phosphosulfate reductase
MSLDTLWGNRVDIAIERLRMFEPADGYYLAFSGGKDSQCIYHLAVAAGVKFDAHFSVTTVDPPEVLRFIKENYPDVAWERPAKSMFRLIVDRGTLPTRTMRFCCENLKEDKGIDRTVMTGIRWQESNARRKRSMSESCYKVHKLYLHPIIDWSDSDVWSYLDGMGVPHCELYDCGFKRIGCVMCPMAGAKRQAADAERWPRFAHMYKAAADRAYQRRSARGDTMAWASGEDIYNWWITGTGPSVDDDSQLSFFEG